MRKRLFGVRPVNQFDVIVAAGTAVIAVFGFLGTLHEYKTEQASENQENES